MNGLTARSRRNSKDTLNEIENTINPNLWKTAKAVLRRKSIVIRTYLNKQEKYKINNTTLHIKELEKGRVMEQAEIELALEERVEFVSSVEERLFHLEDTDGSSTT